MYESSLNDNGFAFKDLEKRIYKYACEEACNALKSVLESLDEKLFNERDTKIYRNKGRKQTCLRTIMGDVEYSRRIYEFKLENGKKAQKQLLKLFRESKIDEGLETIVNMMIVTEENNNAFKKLTELYDYLVHNREVLVQYKSRDNIILPTPPEGIEYRQLGTMEHNICDVLAQRMKGRKMSWSINGADNLSKILSAKFSNRLFDTVDKIYRNIIPSEARDNIVTKLPLTVFQANKEAKKCKTYKCSSASIPYRDVSVTLGRKAIRDLCGLKIFSDISYN